MIAEIIPEAYDAKGHQVSQPFYRRKSVHPTFPMGRYVSQPLTIRCHTIGEIRAFLMSCKYVSDQELFGKRDYWQPPEDFEKRKMGDCEDFALWVWRQLLDMGYEARFIGGSAGRYGNGHAWVEYFQDGRCFLLEPLYCRAGYTMPRLSTLRYEPHISVSWDGKTLRYFSHKKPDFACYVDTSCCVDPGISCFLGVGLAQYRPSSSAVCMEHSPKIRLQA